MFDRLKALVPRGIQGYTTIELKAMREQALKEEDPYKAALMWRTFTKHALDDLEFEGDLEEEGRSDLARKTLHFLKKGYQFVTATAGSTETLGEFLDRTFKEGFDKGETSYEPLGDRFNSFLPLNELLRRCHSLTLDDSLAPYHPQLEKAVARLYGTFVDISATHQAFSDFDQQSRNAQGIAQNVDQVFLVRQGRDVLVDGRPHRVVDEELHIKTSLTDLLEPISHPGDITPIHQALQVGADLLSQIAALEGKVLAKNLTQQDYAYIQYTLGNYARLIPDVSVKIGDASVKTMEIVPYFDRLIKERIQSASSTLRADYAKLNKAAVQAFRAYAGQNRRGRTVEEAVRDSPTFANALNAFVGFTRTYSRVLEEDESTLREDVEAIPEESSDLKGDLLLPSVSESTAARSSRPASVTYVLPPGFVVN